MNIPTIHLVLLVAATWRLANLLANEDGPFHFFKTLRAKVARIEVKSRRKNGIISKLHLYEGVNCEYCNSIWFGTLLGWGYVLLSGVAVPLVVALILPLALSTGAILIKHTVFLVKSIDTRFDQQNQTYLAEQKAIEEARRRPQPPRLNNLDNLKFRPIAAEYEPASGVLAAENSE